MVAEDARFPDVHGLLSASLEDADGSRQRCQDVIAFRFIYRWFDRWLDFLVLVEALLVRTRVNPYEKLLLMQWRKLPSKMFLSKVA